MMSIVMRYALAICSSIVFSNLLAQPVTSLTLQVGQAHVLQEPGVKRIAVGNGKIVQVQALDDRQILLIPESPGQTGILLWNKNGAERSVNLTVVGSDVQLVQEEVRSLLGVDSGLTTRVVGDKIVLEGQASSDLAAARAAEISKRFAQVINLVGRVGLERMIALDVRMIEIKRSLMQEVGIKWTNREIGGPSFGIVGDLHRSRGYPDTKDYVAPFKSFFNLAASLTSAINLAVSNGDAVVLAEPRLSCRSGGSARFIAGGELPMPVQVGQGQISVQFKEYGVKFEISPTVSESGVIASRIVTEISSLSEDVKVNGIPGLIKRRAETDVNLRENETLVIAGLLTDETGRSLDKVAGLGDIPILGALFRSRNFRESKTELVVLITPHFIGGEQLPAADTAKPLISPKDANERIEQSRNIMRMVE
jgi:pilus assembly protein CpaC